MGLLASIFAYLLAVTAIVVAYLMSFDAFLYRPDRAMVSRPAITSVSNPGLVKAKKMPQKKMPQTNADQTRSAARNTSEARTIPNKSTAAEFRRRTYARTSLYERHAPRRLDEKRAMSEPRNSEHAKSERATPSPAQQRRAAPYALGYAEEPASRFGNRWP